jgi:hypothetical protein
MRGRAASSTALVDVSGTLGPDIVPAATSHSLARASKLGVAFDFEVGMLGFMHNSTRAFDGHNGTSGAADSTGGARPHS